MGMEVETVYGYGLSGVIPTSNLCEFIKAHRATVETFERGPEILAFLDKGKYSKAKEKFYDYTRDDDSGCFDGLGCIVADIISVETGIYFNYYVADGESNSDIEAILYEPSYPWQLSDKERELTKEKMDEMLQAYNKELGGKLDVDAVKLDYIG